MPHMPKRPNMQLAKFRFIMCHGSLGAPPNVFDGVEFRRIRRQEVEFDEMFLSFQPLSHFWGLMILSVVADHMNFPPSVVTQELFKECYEGVGVEPGFALDLTAAEVVGVNQPVAFPRPKSDPPTTPLRKKSRREP